MPNDLLPDIVLDYGAVAEGLCLRLQGAAGGPLTARPASASARTTMLHPAPATGGVSSPTAGTQTVRPHYMAPTAAILVKQQVRADAAPR
jgi:hypothetical protein